LNGDVLKRTRLWTLSAAAGLSAVLAFAVSLHFAAGLLLTAVWAVSGFWCLERLLRAALVPPGTRRNGLAILGWGAGKLAIYALAIWAVLESPFPPASHLIGFSLLLVVLVAAGATVLPRDLSQPARRGDDG
jgi:hypothetical protein